MLEKQINAIWYDNQKPISGILNYALYFFVQFALYLSWPFFQLGRYYISFKSKYKSSFNLEKLNNNINNNINSRLMIIIGNITVGGTGKTPLVLQLAEQLKKLGYFPGIISKGYLGRKVLASAMPHEIKLEDSPRDWGDEAVLLAHKLHTSSDSDPNSDSAVPVIVCKNRLKAIEALVQTHPNINIILSDDGLQDNGFMQWVNSLHSAQVLKLCIIDSQRGFGNQKLLPLGPLREPKAKLVNYHHMMIHESHSNFNANFNSGASLPAMNNAIFFQSSIIAFYQLNHTNTDLSLSLSLKLKNLSYKPKQFARAFHTVRAVTGIGNPDRFFQSLKTLGLSLQEKAYADHVHYQVSDLIFGDNLPIVMTEKDAIKIKAFADQIKAPIWVAKLALTGLDPLINIIQDKINKIK